jgi:hypothetical protein
MGKPKKFTARTLARAVDAYFDSITREVEVTERVDTGRRDGQGHRIFETKPVANKLGQTVRVTEYLVPPSVRELCCSLGITRATWSNYADPDKHPELAGIVEEARERMRAWNERELVTRPGKDVRGIIFNLQANYGCGVKAEPAPAAQEDDPITRSLKEAAHALRKTDGDPPLALHGQDRADL